MSASGFAGPGDIGASLHANSTTWLIDADTGGMVPHFAEVTIYRSVMVTFFYFFCRLRLALCECACDTRATLACLNWKTWWVVSNFRPW